MKNSIAGHITLFVVALVLTGLSISAFVWLWRATSHLQASNQELFQHVTHLQTKQLRLASLIALAKESEAVRKQMNALFFTTDSVPAFLEFLEKRPALRRTKTKVARLTMGEKEVAVSLVGVGDFTAVVRALNDMATLPRAVALREYNVQYNEGGKYWRFSATLLLLTK